jgi:Chalcone isomerase-like
MRLFTLLKFRSFVLAVVFAAAGSQAGALTIADQAFADRIRLADTELVLNGVGLRAVAWLKGYAAGLYLPQRADNSEAVLAAKGPKRVQMKMLIEVDAKEFVKAFDVGIKRNHGSAEQAALRDRMAQFNRTVKALGVLKQGDVIDLDFMPPRGLVLSVNGTVRGQPLPGEDLYAGLLKIFIGDKPVDAKLKAGLLGSR